MIYGLLHFLLFIVAVTVLMVGLDKHNRNSAALGVILFMIWSVIAVVH